MFVKVCNADLFAFISLRLPDFRYGVDLFDIAEVVHHLIYSMNASIDENTADVFIVTPRPNDDVVTAASRSEQETIGVANSTRIEKCLVEANHRVASFLLTDA